MLPLVAGEDVARVAVGLLTSPSLPASASYRVIGAAIALRDIIATFGRVLNRDVRYEEISDEAWQREARARGYDPHAVKHLSHLWQALRALGLNPETASAKFAVTDSIETLGGAKPKTLEAFVREEQGSFEKQL